MTSSTSAGTGTHCAAGTTVRSAMPPNGGGVKLWCRPATHSLVQVDGRASFRRIAEVFGTSDQTVARRYARLCSSGHALVVAALTWLGPARR